MVEQKNLNKVVKAQKILDAYKERYKRMAETNCCGDSNPDGLKVPVDVRVQHHFGGAWHG